MTHTPGPWRIGGRDSVVCDTEIPQFQTAGSVDAYGGHLVAESIARENLYIISAAPEMLEALEAALQFVEHFSHSWNGTGEHPMEIAVKARTAIAKARGTTWPTSS